jgi:MFS family permease
VAEDPAPFRFAPLAVIAVTVLMVILDATIVNIAMPAVATDLEIAPANLQWIVTAYTLTFGGFLLLGGRIADFWGRKRTYLVGAAGFAVASALGGMATNEGLLFAARALQGAFGALPWRRPRWRCSPCCSPTPRSAPRPSLSTARSPVAVRRWA